MTIKSVVSSYDTLRQAVISYTGNKNTSFTDFINNDIRLAEADLRNLRLPLMKSDPETANANGDFIHTALTDAQGRIPVPSDMLEPIYFYQYDPLVQYNRRGAQEVQREAYENRYGVFGASSDVWVSYQGEFGNVGLGMYQVTPRPVAGTRIYLYYYRDWDSLGPNGFEVRLTGTVNANGNIALPINETETVNVPVTSGQTAVQVANAYTTLYNNTAPTGNATVTTDTTNVANVRVTELFRDSIDLTTVLGLGVEVAQVIQRDNFLIRQAPELYLHTTLKHSYGRVRNNEQRDYYDLMSQQSFRSLVEADARAEKKGGRRTKRTKFAPRRRGSLRS